MHSMLWARRMIGCDGHRRHGGTVDEGVCAWAMETRPSNRARIPNATSPVPGFMSSWDSRSPTSAAVAEDLSVPIPPQPFSVDVEAGPPTFSGTSLRLLDAKRTLPPLLARLLKSVAFTSGVAKDEYGKNGLCLLPIFDRALCLVPLVQSALLAFGQLM